MTKDVGQVFYHVTFESRLKSIKKLGLTLGRKRNWNNSFGSKLGSQDHIHLFGDLEGAARWAHKMNYDFDKPVAILACHASGLMEKDPNVTAQWSGEALITSEPIPPEAITGVIHPDFTLYRQIVNGGVIVDPPTWLKF